jgi:hypothetical protein
MNYNTNNIYLIKYSKKDDLTLMLLKVVFRDLPRVGIQQNLGNTNHLFLDGFLRKSSLELIDDINLFIHKR